MGRVGVYAALVRAQIRAQTQYRLSFAFDLLFNVVITFVDTVTILVIFRITPVLGGFDLPDALLLSALAGIAFALADLSVGNIERLPKYVREGLLDTVLVRPLGALSQLIVGDLSIRRIGRIVQGLGVLIVAVVLADVRFTPAVAAMLIIVPLAGAVTFAAIFVTGASLSFWLVEAGEVANAFTYGGRDFTLYPTTVYTGWFRRAFAYGLGFAAVIYFPTLAILGRPDPLGTPTWLHWVAPGVAVVWCGVAWLAWRTGIRRYRSTGS